MPSFGHTTTAFRSAETDAERGTTAPRVPTRSASPHPKTIL